MTTEILVKCAQQLSENINTELDKIFEGIDTVVMEHRLLTDYEFMKHCESIKSIKQLMEDKNCHDTHQADFLYMAQRDITQREDIIRKNNKAFEDMFHYIKTMPDDLIETIWASFVEEYEFDGEDDDDEGMRLMKKLTDYYYLKSPKIFDRLWDERNGKWNHEAKEVIFNLDD